MKPILVGDCNNYSFDTNNCTKCGRSMPDMCVEFEEMKRKAEAYDKMDTIPSSPNDTPDTTERSDGPPVSPDLDPYVQKAASSRKPGRPRK